MVLEGPGVFTLTCTALEPMTEREPSFASVSAPATIIVMILRGAQLVDKVYVQGTHTWWPQNPLFKPPLAIGERVSITLSGPGAMRLGWHGLTLD